MKRISIFAVAASVAAILACGGGDETTTSSDDGGTVATGGSYTTGGTDGALRASDLPTVSLKEPWVSMNLPTSGGNVVVSDSAVLLVAYDGGSISSYASSYGAAVEKDGWTKKEDYSTADFKAILFEKSGGELGMAVGTEQGINFVYFENLKEVTASNSRVRAAKGGSLRMNDRVQNLRAKRAKRRGKRKGGKGGKGGKGKR